MSNEQGVATFVVAHFNEPLEQLYVVQGALCLLTTRPLAQSTGLAKGFLLYKQQEMVVSDL
jgi:hypothetical protein